MGFPALSVKHSRRRTTLNSKVCRRPQFHDRFLKIKAMHVRNRKFYRTLYPAFWSDVAAYKIKAMCSFNDFIYILKRKYPNSIWGHFIKDNLWMNKKLLTNKPAYG